MGWIPHRGEATNVFFSVSLSLSLSQFNKNISPGEDLKQKSMFSTAIMGSFKDNNPHWP